MNTNALSLNKRHWAALIRVVVITVDVGLAIAVGVPFALIIGGSATLAYLVWLGMTYRRPADPDSVLSL